MSRCAVFFPFTAAAVGRHQLCLQTWSGFSLEHGNISPGSHLLSGGGKPGAALDFHITVSHYIHFIREVLVIKIDMQLFPQMATSASPQDVSVPESAGRWCAVLLSSLWLTPGKAQEEYSRGFLLSFPQYKF